LRKLQIYNHTGCKQFEALMATDQTVSLAAKLTENYIYATVTSTDPQLMEEKESEEKEADTHETAKTSNNC
jgi:hypothetical protein